MSEEIQQAETPPVSYYYPSFDETGRCVNVVATPVPLDLPHVSEEKIHPDDIYLEKNGIVKQRIRVELSADKMQILADGEDTPTIEGLPEDGVLLVNGMPNGDLTLSSPGLLIVTAAGKYVSDTLCIEGASLKYFQDRALASIDDQAVSERSQYVTNIDGQQAIYAKKEAEARSILAGESGSFPYITAEAGQDAAAQVALAQTIVAKADECDAALAQIEAVRLSAKTNVMAATTIPEVLAATEINWP